MKELENSMRSAQIEAENARSEMRTYKNRANESARGYNQCMESITKFEQKLDAIVGSRF